MKNEPPAEREIADLIAPAFDRLPTPDTRRLAAIEQHLLTPARPHRRALTWWWLAAVLAAGAASALWWTVGYDSGKGQETPGATVTSPSVAPAITGQPVPVRPSQSEGTESTPTGEPTPKPGPVIYQRER